MDIIRLLGVGVHRFIEGGKLVFEDIRTLPSRDLVAEFNDIDYRLGMTIILLTTVVVSFATLFIYANFFSSDTSVLQKRTEGIVERPGDPERPPPSQIVSMHIYPVKSCRGIEVSSTRLKRSGLTLDRNWMFVGADGKFMTIRTESSMTLIDTAISENTKGEQMLEISIHGTDARVVIPAFPTRKWLEENTKLRDVEIWEAETDAWEYGDDINRIFRDFFNTECSLVYKGPTARNVGVNGKVALYGKATPHHFADVMSLQISSEASINDLNKRLKARHGDNIDTLSIERFRPNIVIRGREDKPWEEDNWKRIRITTTLHEEEAIYSIDLDVVAKCARCQVPNVNPDTAEKHPKEPWDELMK